jgi:hypothetical protein
MRFPTFEASLRHRRVLKGYNIAHWILRGVPEFMRDQAHIAPKKAFQDSEFTGIEVSSYARTPGAGVLKLEDYIKNELPSDFATFYTAYSEALVITRTFPLHLWSIEAMISSIEEMRQVERCPNRFFRFGEQWDREAAQFALWQHTPGVNDWWVVATSREYHDDYFDDENQTDYNLLGYSFGSWIEDWVKRDGLPDPLMGLDSKGGFLDPVDS